MTSSTGRPVRALTSSIDCAMYEDVLTAELALRIARRIAARFDAEALEHDSASSPSKSLDLVGSPHVEGALALLVFVAERRLRSASSAE